MHKLIHNGVKHNNRRRNKRILALSSQWLVPFGWPGTRAPVGPPARAAVRLPPTGSRDTAAALGLPTRMTNNAGATKAQIAPFSSESQQLQRKTRTVSDETHGHLISNALNLEKGLKENAKRAMNFKSKRHDRASVRSSFPPRAWGIWGRA